MVRRIEAVVIGSFLVAAMASADDCADILKNGIFNSSQKIETAAASLTYRAWQCSHEFRNHNQAIDAGLSVGFIAYGVPVRIGGSWKEGHVEAWKKSNCSQTDLKKDRQQATVELIQTLAPELVSGWVQCWELKGLQSAIDCSVEQQGTAVVFSARWKRTVGDTNEPVITYYHDFDTQCARQLPIGNTIPEGGVSVPCQFEKDSDPAWVLDTTRGKCFKSFEVPRTTRVFSGRTYLDSSEAVNADEVIFRPGALVVTNGNTFTVKTGKLTVEGGVARILSFERRENRGPGDDGRSAAPLTIFAKQFSGTALEIDNHGEDGTDGRNGNKGTTGSRGGQGKQHKWDPLKGCHGATNSGRGGTGGEGEDGQDGGYPGNGGAVTLRVCGITENDPLDRIRVVDTSGGKRGKGGKAGPGGDGGEGGKAVPGTSHCGGKPPGPPGYKGKDGRPGKTPTRDGTPGEVFWLACDL